MTPTEARELLTPTTYAKGEDFRFAGPTRRCLCGGDMFHMLASFDEDGQLSYYLLDGLCWACGANVTLPTPVQPDLMSNPDV